MSLIARTLTAALLLGAAPAAQAAVITLDFEGVGNFNPVGEFYNGGAGGNLGVSFSENALAIVDADAGGGGNFGGEPSPDTILFFLSGTAATLNYLDGFTDGFSFFYSAVNNSGSISVYDGLNGTGNVLASLFLPVTPSDGGDPNGNFSPFFAIGVAFSGIARSIDFAGTANQIAFDNITFGSVTPGGGDPSPVPVPASLPLLAAGLGGLALARRRAKA
jgi:opacity protein-like surface antigen